jgi:gas vesicle protein
MPSLEAVREDLDTASLTLDQMRTAMREGTDVDMDTFNLKVAETCKAAVSLPKAEAPQVRQQLEHLLEKLNETRDEIEREQQTAAKELTLTKNAGARTEHTAGLTMPTDEPIAGGEEPQ